MSGLNSARQADSTGRQIVRKSKASVWGFVTRRPLLLFAACALMLNTTAGGATLSTSATLTASCGASEPVGSGVVEFRLRDDACLISPFTDP